MFELVQISESHELSDALEKLGQEAARLQTVIDTVPSFLWTSLPDGSHKPLRPVRLRLFKSFTTSERPPIFKYNLFCALLIPSLMSAHGIHGSLLEETQG